MANNSSYKPTEGKREEFRRYLEKTGVMDALTKVLVLLYEEADKPDDALKFILNSLSKQMGFETIDDLKTQISELQSRISQLERDSRAEVQKQRENDVPEGPIESSEGGVDSAEADIPSEVQAAD